MIQINPLKSYIDGGVRAAITTPPSASLVFDLPGKAIWVKGVKLKGTDHTYTFNHDNYTTLINTPDKNNPESEDIKIGVNITTLKKVIDTTYNGGTLALLQEGLNTEERTWLAKILHNYINNVLPITKNIKINNINYAIYTTEKTLPLFYAPTSLGTSGQILSCTSSGLSWVNLIQNTDYRVSLSAATNNNDYRIILKQEPNNNPETSFVRFSEYLTFNPSTKTLKINNVKVITNSNIYVGATSTTNAITGLVPAATSAQYNYFLRGDGTWAIPSNTWRPVKVEGTEKLGSNALDLSAGNGISIIYNSDTKKIVITNTKPDVNHNTDRTGIKLATVSGTKKTDSTLILANSVTGLNIQGGTNKFLIGDGTNYIEVPVVPSVSNKDATIGTALTTIATVAGVDIKAKIASYSLSNHTHSVTINGSTKTITTSGTVDLGNYLPLSGGTMNGTAWIAWPDSGNWGNNNSGVTFPVTRGGLQWSGLSDYVKLFTEETSYDNLNLVLQFGDDNSNGLSIRNASNIQTSYISAGGVITTKTFKGNLDWSYITNKPSSYTPSAHTHAWNSLTHSSTTENQAILTNGKANGWKLYTLNISGWNNAANNVHSHSNKSVLDGITSALVSNWNTAYTFVSTITGEDTDKVINKWDEIVNFLAGITEDNKLNTLLNSKLSILLLSAKDILTTKTNNALFWVNTIGTASSITTGPFTDRPYALLSVTNYNLNTKNSKFFYRSRLAFNSSGDIKVASCHHENEYKLDETWYNVLTSKNSGISGSTIKLNGTSITVYSSSTADGRYVKKSGDTMSGALNFANNTWNKVGDDIYMGDHNIGGQLCLMGITGNTGISFHKLGDASIRKSITFNGSTLYMNGNCDYASLANLSNLLAMNTVPNKTTSTSVGSWSPISGRYVFHQRWSDTSTGSDCADFGIYLDGNLTANMVLDGYYNSLLGFRVIGATGGFLKANGTIDNSTYLTSHLSLSNYYTKSEVDTKLNSKLNYRLFWERTNIDLNNITEAWHTYEVNNGTDTANTPTNASWHQAVLWGTGDTNYAVLLCTAYTSDYSLYLRHKIAGKWYNWIQLAATTDIPSSLKNPHALTISLNGTSQGPYDGSIAKSINITPSSIGAATNGHNHDSSYVKYGKVVKSTTDNANATPYLYNVENEEVISGYYKYWYIFNMGQYSGGNFGTLIAMPYQDNLTDSELFIRSAKSGSWRTWRRVLHSNNYAAILDSRYYTESEINTKLGAYLPLTGGTMTGNLSFSNSGTGFRGINYGTMGDNDLWRIGGAATGSNGGYMEIATADDGNEPIYVRQYTGVFSTLKRTLTLLDGNGNTILPGSATAIGFNKSGSSNSYVLLGGGGHKLVSDFATSAQGIGTIISISKSLTPTTSWIDTGIKTDSATFPGGNGSYIVQISIPSSSGTDGWGDLYTGYFSLYTGTDSSTEDEILLHGASHALLKRIYLKTKATANTDGTMHFYIASEKAFSAARTINFKFRKLI